MRYNGIPGLTANGIIIKLYSTIYICTTAAPRYVRYTAVYTEILKIRVQVISLTREDVNKIPGKYTRYKIPGTEYM